MSLKPFWQTPSGSLGNFTQGVEITPIQLAVQNADTVSVISKNLPSGLRLDSVSKIISGIPLDEGITQTHEFVIRASIVDNGITRIQDRTFSVTVISNAQPILLTPAGTLSFNDSGEHFILNHATVNFQFVASAVTVPAGQKIKYYIEDGSGELPPGLKLSETGILYGTVNDDLELDYKLVQGSYDKDFYDVNPYDYSSNIEQGTALAQVVNGKIESVDITYGGNGYLLDPEVIIGGGIDIGTVTVSSNGSGYSSAPTVVFQNSQTSGGITAKGYAIMGGAGSSQYVAAIQVTEQGTGYTSAPTIYFQDQNTGSGASANCKLQSGSGAELIARVSDGSVVSIDIANQGANYGQATLPVSFGLPTAGSRIISKTYKFEVTVANGDLFDTKVYTIIVKSEDSLRVDTTFILSDTDEFDTSRTYIQPPIWVTSSILPVVKGNNNFIYDLEVFDPTPQVGKIYFSLMDVNFDGTLSTLGPLNKERNQVTFNISGLTLTFPASITTSTEHDFKDGDRVKINNIVGTTELNGEILYVKVVSRTKVELFSDVVLTNGIDARFFNAYQSGGTVNPEVNYLTIDPIGGEINGFVPYQPHITQTYYFTVKVQRVVEDVEVASAFKEFEVTIEGNITGDITYTTPTLVGALKPNEQSLLRVDAVSTLPSADVNYQLVPGYGKSSSVNYIELTLSERAGDIYIDGYGINPVMTFEKGQSYKINVSLTDFKVSFRNIDDSYYNDGIRHSTGAVGQAAQEKNSGYYIFIPPFDNASRIRLVYTNAKRDGLVVSLKDYDQNTKTWNRLYIDSYFTSYDAYYNNVDEILAGKDVYAVFLNYNKIKFSIRKYNTSTLLWDLVNVPTVKPTNPTVNNLWLDLDDSSFGVLEYRYVGIQGIWTPVNVPVVTSVPLNSVGSNGNYTAVNTSGEFSVLRKINNVWKELEIIPQELKSAFDPNVFFKPYNKTSPVTNLQGDVWFKYKSIYNGKHQEIISTLKSLDNLPTDISISLSGEIIGKISPNTGNTYKSYYKSNTLYVANDVVTFNNILYICVDQYRSSGNWFQDLDHWKSFVYTKRTATSIDVNSYGVNKFNIHSLTGDDGTTIDNLLRFRIKAQDTLNVGITEKDFNIRYDAVSNLTLTNIYLQPFLTKTSRDTYFNFITDTTIFLDTSLYRHEDPTFGVQRIPKMLLLGGIESTTADRYASAVQRNYYDRPLYFGDLKTAIAKTDEKVEYEVIYVEINDPYEVNNISVRQNIKLDFDYDPLTVDYSKVRVDQNNIVATETGLDTIYPSSITLMQNELKKVTLQKTDSVLITPTYEDWGGIIGSASESDNWGTISERVALFEDFLSVIQSLTNDDKYRPLWMNTSQDGTGNPIGFVKAVPICYVKPGESAKILKLIEKSKFDFKALNFTIDRIIIQNPQGETGDKYIKFINREII